MRGRSKEADWTTGAPRTVDRMYVHESARPFNQRREQHDEGMTPFVPQSQVGGLRVHSILARAVRRLPIAVAIGAAAATAVAEPVPADTERRSPVGVEHGVATSSPSHSGPVQILAARREGSSRSTRRLKGRKVGAARGHQGPSVRLAGRRWKSTRRNASRTRSSRRRRSLARSSRKSLVSPPRASTLPAISGTAQEGQMLTAGTASWIGAPTSYGYQWLRCDSAGSDCADVASATAQTYALVAGDVGSTMRVRVTATNSYGSGSVTTAQTAVVTDMAPAQLTSSPSPSGPFPAPAGFPDSFFTGPLGNANIVPGKTTGALLGTWLPGVPGWTWEQQKQLFLDRQAYVGRKYDIAHVHYAAPPGKCYWIAPLSDARAMWSADNGYTLVVSWTHGWKISEINAGLADACLEEVGARFAAWNKPVLLRIYWEFNGDWMNWSGSGKACISAWKRTVNKIRAAGGTNVGFLWSPASGYRDRAFASYPGDEWVDWVGVSAYNWNKSGAWCNPYDSGPWCELAPVLTHDPVKHPTVYDVYSQRKPFMVAETGSVEDTTSPGRKGQWLRNAGATIPIDVSNVRGLTYFDVDVAATENVNWRLDTSQPSLDGFRSLALDPFFNTR